MSAIIDIFEVRIEKRSDNPIRWHSWKDGAEYEKSVETLHIERRTREQAVKIGSKRGRVLSCRKIDRDVITGNIEMMPIQNHIYVNQSPYKNAIAMDEMIWKKKPRKLNKKPKTLDI